MAFQEKENIFFAAFLTVAILALPLVATENIDCNGKAFHCVNSTHFKICVDIGGGVSKTVDDFLIPCPRNTACKDDNYFECELTTTPATTQQSELTNDVGSSSTTPSKEIDALTLFPEYNTRKVEELSNYQISSVPTTKLSSSVVPTVPADLSSFTLWDEADNRVNLSGVNYTQNFTNSDLSESVKISYKQDSSLGSVTNAEIFSPTKVNLNNILFNVTLYDNVTNSGNGSVIGNLPFSENISKSNIGVTKSVINFIESLNYTTSRNNENNNYMNEVNNLKSSVSYSSSTPESIENSVFTLKTTTITSLLNEDVSLPDHLNTENIEAESSTYSNVFKYIINNDPNIMATDHTTTSDFDSYSKGVEFINDTILNLTIDLNSTDVPKERDISTGFNTQLFVSNDSIKNEQSTSVSPTSYTNLPKNVNKLEISATSTYSNIDSSSSLIKDNFEIQTEKPFTTERNKDTNKIEDLVILTNYPNFLSNTENIISDTLVTTSSYLLYENKSDNSVDLDVAQISDGPDMNIGNNYYNKTYAVNSTESDITVNFPRSLSRDYSNASTASSEFNITLNSHTKSSNLTEPNIEPFVKNNNVVDDNKKILMQIETSTISSSSSSTSSDFDIPQTVPSDVTFTDIETSGVPIVPNENLSTPIKTTTIASFKSAIPSDFDNFKRESSYSTTTDIETSSIQNINNDGNLSKVTEPTTFESSKPNTSSNIDISKRGPLEMSVTDLETSSISVIHNDRNLPPLITPTTTASVRSMTLSGLNISNREYSDVTIADLETSSIPVNNNDGILSSLIESSTLPSSKSKTYSNVDILIREPLNVSEATLETSSSPVIINDGNLSTLIESSTFVSSKYNVFSDADISIRESVNVSVVDLETSNTLVINNDENLSTLIKPSKSITSSDVEIFIREPSDVSLANLETSTIPATKNDGNVSTLIESSTSESSKSDISSDIGIFIEEAINVSVTNLETSSIPVNKEDLQEKNFFTIIETSTPASLTSNISSDGGTSNRELSKLTLINSDPNNTVVLNNGNSLSKTNDSLRISGTKLKTSADVSKREPSHPTLKRFKINGIPVLINDSTSFIQNNSSIITSSKSSNSSYTNILNRDNLLLTVADILKADVTVLNDDSNLSTWSDSNNTKNKLINNTSQINTNLSLDVNNTNTIVETATFKDSYYTKAYREDFSNSQAQSVSVKSTPSRSLSFSEIYQSMTKIIPDKYYSEIAKTEKQSLSDLNTDEKIISTSNVSNLFKAATEKDNHNTTIHKSKILNIDKGVQNYSLNKQDEIVSTLNTVPSINSSNGNTTIHIQTEPVKSILNVIDPENYINTTRITNEHKIFSSFSNKTNNSVIDAIVTKASSPIYRQNIISNQSYEFGVKETNSKSNDRVLIMESEVSIKASNKSTSDFNNTKINNNIKNTNLTIAFDPLSYTEPSLIYQKAYIDSMSKIHSSDKDSLLHPNFIYPNSVFSSKPDSSALLSNPIETTLTKPINTVAVTNFNFTSKFTNNSTTTSSFVKNEYNELSVISSEKNKSLSHKLILEDQNHGLILSKSHNVEKLTEEPHKDVVLHQVIIKSNPQVVLDTDHKNLLTIAPEPLPSEQDEIENNGTSIKTNPHSKLEPSKSNEYFSKIPSTDSVSGINNNQFSQVTKKIFLTDNLHTTENKHYAHIDSLEKPPTLEFSCVNRHRSKYSDKNNCNKFYICIGKPEPIIGMCPVGTVFSEINKQCTKNLAHCIRNNQFRCLTKGRFIDVLSDQFYYICVRKLTGYIRFKLKCLKNYTLNKENVKCTPDSASNESISKTNSDNTTNETQSTETAQSVDEEKIFECEKEGTFEYPDDCRKYYRCSKNSKSEFRRKIKKCDSEEVFDKEKKKCVDAESYEC